MAGSAVAGIFSRYSTEQLMKLLADEQVQAECFHTPVSDAAWYRICELESRLPELRLFLDEVVDEGEMKVRHLNGILLAAEEAFEARASYLSVA